MAPTDYDIDTLYNKEENEYLIGVDYGAVHAINSGLVLDEAVGDFDSVTRKELDMIKNHSHKLIKHPNDKDQTDSALALERAYKQEASTIIFYGGLGKRIDHSIANINLINQPNRILITTYSKIYALSPGTHTINNTYKYISFFAMEDVNNLMIKSFKYELKTPVLKVNDPLCISNEGSGTVSFSSGVLLVIHQNE
ncbi:MAG: thiamine diphosphokinase [Candidatus Izimaplasma sp.]|nr:thiamine diphosphokinase [Candidatus Izimaplasma bacterium]